MRILHISDTSIYNYDGISTYINELIYCSLASGDEVLVVTTVPHSNNKLRELHKEIKVHTFPHVSLLSSASFKFGLPFGMKKIVNDFNPDLIWIHTIGTLGLYASAVLGKQYSIIYVKHCFDGDLWCRHLKAWPVFQPFLKWAAYHLENVVLQVCNKMIYHFDQPLAFEKHKYFNKFLHLPPPLNDRFFKNPKENSENKNITIGYCGRLDPEKNIERILNAITIYENKNSTKINLLLIGDGDRKKLEDSQYAHLNVSITGFVNDVIPYLDKLDAFVLASDTETTSLSSLEAYARGLMIFSTPVGYLAENHIKFKNMRLYSTAEELSDLFVDLPLYSIKNDSKELLSALISFNVLYAFTVDMCDGLLNAASVIAI